MDSFPDVVGYVVRARSSGASGFCERSADFFLTYWEVVDVGGEVDVCEGRGRGGREEMVEEGGVDALQSILVQEGGKAGLLPATGEFLCFPHRGGGEGGEVFCPVRELGLLDGTKVGPTR